MSFFDHVVASMLAIVTSLMLVMIAWYASVVPFALSPAMIGAFIIAIIALQNAGLAAAGLLARRYPFFRNFGRFAATGVFNTVLDTGMLSTLSYLTGIYAGLKLAGLNIVAFSLVTALSYLINRSWSFATPGIARPNEFLAFVVVVASSMLINTFIVFIITSGISVPAGISAQQWVVIAKIIGVGFSFLWNFAWMHKYVFRHHFQREGLSA